MGTKKDSSFESQMEELSKLVRELESGKVSLDESIKLYEKGVSLFKKCKKSLNEAEKKINKLTDKLEEERLLSRIIFILFFISACSSSRLKHLDGASVAPVKKQYKQNSIELKEIESKKKKPSFIHFNLDGAYAICTPYLRSVFDKDVKFSYSNDASGFNELMEKRESTSAYEWSIFKLLNNFNFEKNKLITHNFKKFFMGIKFKNKIKILKQLI